MFETEDEKVLRHWFYRILEKWTLTVPLTTRQCQKRSAHVMSVEENFDKNCLENSDYRLYQITSRRLVAGILATTVYSESKPSCTFYHVGSNTVPAFLPRLN